MINLIEDTILYVLNTLVHDAVPLIFGISVASILNVYVNPEKLKSALMKRKKVSIFGSVLFGTFTPLCSCGTMAVVISMLTTVLPWGPIIAFITSSPLMSPDLFVMLSGIINVKFAVALMVSSILIGVFAGYISYYLEKHTHFFDNQIRFSSNAESSSCCSAYKADKNLVNASCSCSQGSCCTSDDNKKADNLIAKYKLDKLIYSFFNLGIKKVLLYFSIFAAIGYFINRFVPSSKIVMLFGAKNMFSVPLAAMIGVPLYVSDAGAIPLIKALMNAGASSGSILAFMITGPGTSVGAIAGSLTIMKKKTVFFYVSILFISAILFGYLYNFLLFIGL